MTSRKALGAASDYYRVRIMHVDDSDSPDFEWRDDIRTFEERADAEEAVAAAEADILDLTRSQFEERYFPTVE
jgi:hypothetical protein